MTNSVNHLAPEERKPLSIWLIWLRRLLVLIVILLPLLLLFALLRAPLSQYTPVVSSDELYYWRQALSFRSVGFNSGYYTYAEQLSPLGNYYSWGIFVPIFQAMVTRLFGWPLYAIPVLNAVLLALALALFIRITKLDIERLLWLIVGLLTFYPLLIYDVTSMLEVLSYAFMVAIAALFYSILKSSTPSWKVGASALILVMVATLLRATFGLFFIPLCLLLLRRRSVRNVGLALLAGIALWAAAWFAVWLTASPFPSPITHIFTALKTNPMHAFELILVNLERNLALFKQAEGFVVVFRQEVILIVAILILSLLLRRLRVLRRVGNLGFTLTETLLQLYNLGLIVLLPLLVYDLADRRDFRLLATHLLFMLLLLVAYRRRIWLIGFAAVGLLLLPQTWNAYLDWSLKLAEPQAQASYVEWHEKLAPVLVYQPDAPTPWCNSVLHSIYYLSSPELSAVLLAIDDGMGISPFQNLDGMSLPLKSHYLLLDDDFYAHNSQQLHVQPLIDVPGGKLYRNLDSACPT